MHMYICNTYTHTCTHIHTHTHINTHIHTYIHTHKHVYICIYAYVYMYAYIYVCRYIYIERERERERDTESNVRTCLRVLVLCRFPASLSLTHTLSLSRKSVFRRMATCYCIIMHDAAADARARQKYMSPSHTHRAGYRHTASASAYNFSLVSMSQHKCAIRILIICLPRHAKGCRYKSYKCLHVGV